MGLGTTTSSLLSTAFGAAIAATLFSASPAQAIEPDCYAADVVRAATWNAEGPAKQFTVIVGERNTDTRNRNFFTSSADGSVGYNIENNGSGPDNGKLCIRAKYTDIHANAAASRPAWASLPTGSPNDRYMQVQEQNERVSIIFGATALVGPEGHERTGPQILVTRGQRLVAGMVAGAVITNDRRGDGDALMALVNLRTNVNFDSMVSSQHASIESPGTALALR